MNGNNKVIFVSLILGILLFGYILGDINIAETMSAFGDLNPNYLAIFIISSILIMAIYVWRWQIVMKAQGMPINYFDLWGYRLADFSISFLTPGPKVGGEYIRASLVEKKYDFRYSRVLSSVVVDKTMEVFSNALIFMIGVILVAMLSSVPKGIKVGLIIISIIFLAFMTGLIYSIAKKDIFHSIFKKLKLRRFKNFEKSLINFEKHLRDFYKTKRSSFFSIIGISVLQWITTIIEYKYLMLMLGMDLALDQLFLLYAFVGVSYLFPIPMALGTMEASQIAGLALLGLKSSLGVLIALVFRVRDLIWSAIGLLVLGYHGMNINEMYRKVMKKS